MKRVPIEERRRACPVGAARGIDVARMYGEIGAIVRKHFASSGVDVDDLVQETAAAIVRKNASEASAFDPERSSFGHYVHLVARSKLGHMLGSRARREHGLVLQGEESALDAIAADAGDEGPLEATAATIADLLEQLAEMVTRAKARPDKYHEGVAAALEWVRTILAEAFDAEALLPLAQRVRGLLTIAGRPLTAGQMSVALGAPAPAIARVLERLGTAVRRRNRDAFELARGEVEASAPRKPSAAAHHVVAMRLTDEELRALERKALARGTTPGLFARDVLRRVA